MRDPRDPTSPRINSGESTRPDKHDGSRFRESYLRPATPRVGKDIANVPALRIDADDSLVPSSPRIYSRDYHYTAGDGER